MIELNPEEKTGGMMKKIVMIILGIIIAGCFIAFYTTTKSFLINNSTEKSDIAVTNGAFDITPESGVEIFNKDLKNAGLSQIPKEYKSSTQSVQVQNGDGEELIQNGVTYYDFKISDSLRLRMTAFSSLDNQITGIALIETTGKKSSEDSKLNQYFQVIAANISPQFNADKFRISRYQNKSFELDHILFWCGHFNSGNNEKKNIYIVTTNSDLFDFYF